MLWASASPRPAAMTKTPAISSHLNVVVSSGGPTGGKSDGLAMIVVEAKVYWNYSILRASEAGVTQDAHNDKGQDAHLPAWPSSTWGGRNVIVPRCHTQNFGRIQMTMRGRNSTRLALAGLVAGTALGLGGS